MSLEEIEKEVNDIYTQVDRVRIRVMRLQVKLSQNKIRSKWNEKADLKRA